MVTVAVKFPRAVGLVSKVTVRRVAVAVVTVPNAPLLNVTMLLAAVVEKPKPLITIVAALMPTATVLVVIAGFTVATWTAPLDFEFVVTVAVILPSDVGRPEMETVRDVDVAPVTVPRAPLLNVILLLARIGSKPNPLIVSVCELAAKSAEDDVTTGVIAATRTAAPLSTPLVATIAVRSPAFGNVAKVTVSEVAVEEVTVPTAPLLKVTTLLLGVVLKPLPAIVNVVLTFAARLVELDVTATGVVTAATTPATLTAVPLVRELVVTTAFKLPATVGRVANVTVSEFAVAAVTVPTALPAPVKATLLLPTVVSKPKPLITRLVPFSPRLVVLEVTLGLTVAIWTAAVFCAPFVVTRAVKFPAVGFLDNVTVSRVAVADVTVPIAPLLNATVLLAAVVLKPEPLMRTVDASGASVADVFNVTTGNNVAT